MIEYNSPPGTWVCVKNSLADRRSFLSKHVDVPPPATHPTPIPKPWLRHRKWYFLQSRPPPPPPPPVCQSPVFESWIWLMVRRRSTVCGSILPRIGENCARLSSADLSECKINADVKTGSVRSRFCGNLIPSVWADVNYEWVRYFPGYTVIIPERKILFRRPIQVSRRILSTQYCSTRAV